MSGLVRFDVKQHLLTGSKHVCYLTNEYSKTFALGKSVNYRVSGWALIRHESFFATTLNFLSSYRFTDLLPLNMLSSLASRVVTMLFFSVDRAIVVTFEACSIDFSSGLVSFFVSASVTG